MCEIQVRLLVSRSNSVKVSKLGCLIVTALVAAAKVESEMLSSWFHDFWVHCQLSCLSKIPSGTQTTCMPWTDSNTGLVRCRVGQGCCLTLEDGTALCTES